MYNWYERRNLDTLFKFFQEKFKILFMEKKI